MKTIPHRPSRLARLSFAALLMTLSAAGTALAWGRIGHRTSAKLCETLLMPATKAAVGDLLEPGESLADASTWADDVRRERRETAPWHYVDVPITDAKYDAKYCALQKEGCVVSKIHDFLAILKDKDAPKQKRREALRFLVHFVQDLHMPLHVGERHDKGGNDLQVRFFDDGSNLHRVWDSGLLERVDRDEARTFDRLKASLTPEFVRGASSGTVQDWADESLAAARDAYVDPVTGTALKGGSKLGQAYQDKHRPVAERRVLQSAARLARLLNEVFDPATSAR